MMRSSAPRSTTRSFTTGKARARHGSMTSVSPLLKLRMWSWQVAVPFIGPCLTVRRLVLHPEVAAARLIAMQRIAAHQLPELQKVGHAAGVLEGLIEVGSVTRHHHVAPELGTQLRDQLERRLESFRAASHPAVLPHDLAQRAVK